MSYLAFALKYRPQNFDEVIGQDHVVISLKNAILKNRVHHAYLFSGPRGVGKTSLARILAKSLNCLKGPTVNPCGKCPSCVEITKGKSLDIIEIDGASNRGIDEIRTLRENVKLSTVASAYKIYIVDEVHMLTQEAFNALLKTLEEPPTHVKFIFATTHPHKVLPTILSRCQKFQFNLIPLESIVAKLKKIVEAEKIEIEENLLYTIGRVAGGSIRDAESLLDQLVPVILEKGSLKDIFSFLGIVDEESLNKVLESVVEKDLSSCLDFVEKTVKDGKDLGIFLNALIEHLRNLLLAKVSLKNFGELSDISPQSKDFIRTLSKKVSVSDILKIIDLFLEAKDLSHRLNSVRVPFELALIRYTYNPEPISSPPLDSPGSGHKQEKEPPLESEEKDEDFDLEMDDFGLGRPDLKTEDKEKDAQESQREESQREDNILLPLLLSKWQEIISSLQKTRAALASHLSFAQPLASYGSILTVGFSPKDRFHKESVEGNKNGKLIEEVISQFMGQSVRVKFVLKELPQKSLDTPSNSKDSPEEKEGGKPQAQDVKKDISQDSFLNELLDTFGGKFHNEES